MLGIRICSAARAENRAAAAQLVAIRELFDYRLSRCSENEDWEIDTIEAVAAETRNLEMPFGQIADGISRFPENT